MEIEIDLRDIKNFSYWAKKAPQKAVRKATALTLNSMAFDLRREYQGRLKRDFVIRQPKLLDAKLRVDKTRLSAPVNKQLAQVGSVKNIASAAHGRFTGWEEQETGKRDERSRTHLPMARPGGNFKKKIRPAVRAKRGRKFIRPSSFGMSGNKKTGSQILGAAKRLKINEPLRIGNLLYKRRGRRFDVVQNLKRKPKQPKRVLWMKTANDRYYRWVKPSITWNKHMKRLLSKP